MSPAEAAAGHKDAGTRAKPAAMAPFGWEDPLLLEDQLNEERRLVRDAAHDYCQDKLMPRIIEANRKERFDREIMHEMGALRAKRSQC